MPEPETYSHDNIKNFSIKYMTIYFNPYYDASVFLTKKDCGLGKLYVGKEGLFNELELRAGLTIHETDNTERIINYMRAMQDAIDAEHDTGGPLFFEDSFSRDDIGTAALMLGWRDSLVKVGWDGIETSGSCKLDGLAKIESHFKCPGYADRWRTMLGEISGRAILKPSDRIMVQCAKPDLEPVMKHLFETINSHYDTPIVEYLTNSSRASQINTEYIHRHNFKNEYEAHEWIASQTLSDTDVVAEADQAILADMLYTLGKPAIGAADKGIGSIMRLLPLGIALFKNPADITTLQAYLQTPRNPLDRLHIKVEDSNGGTHYIPLTRKLLDHICSEGGFGPKWQELIDKAIYDHTGAALSRSDVDSATRFINMWERSLSLPKGEASVTGVADFVKRLSSWAGSSIVNGSESNIQFMALKQHCSFMSKLLSSCKSTTVPIDRILRWATHICIPINISSDYARIGSMNVVGNLGDIYSSPTRLIWYASTTDNTVPYEYDFLSPGEISALNGAGVRVPRKELMARLDKAYKEEVLHRCHDITIVTCERISGVETVPGAVFSAVLSQLKDKPLSPAALCTKTASGKVNSDTGKKAIHKFDPSILEDFARKRESYSSINTLIQSPVDYLLDYFKKYGQYDIKETADLPTTEGNVAHCYIETLGKLCGNDAKDMLTRHRKDYETILNDIINETGLILCLEENQIENQSFRAGLRDSVEVLLGIIIDNNLLIEGFEYEITSTIKPFGSIFAKIDCLLIDPADGKMVIFDFKWNSGRTYERKIEENRELQLAIYRKVIETGGEHPETGERISGREVKFIGYYSIPRKTIYTPKNTLHDNPAIMEVEKKDERDIFRMACDGYTFRLEQLKSGELEEAEGLKLEGLDYHRNPMLYALEADYDDSSLKARAYGSRNIVLKGGLV